MVDSLPSFNVTSRDCGPEVMDTPGLDPIQHAHALQGLSRINWWSRIVEALWPPIHALAVRRRPDTLRILDIATGGGDLPVRLWRRSRQSGLPLQIDGCDISPTAVRHARQRAASAGAAVHFFELDALNRPLPCGYDVLTCSLFTHHLTDEQTVRLLREMSCSAAHLLLINDLRRSTAGLLLATIGTRLLTRSSIVHHDGARSVRAAYTISEIQRLAAQAGLADARVARRWPCRFVLSWRRP